MHISAFDWDEMNEDHIAEHGVAIFEVQDALLYRRPLFVRGSGGKYIAHGVTEEGSYLFIVFVFKGIGRVRVITARDMTYKDKRLYKKRRGGEMT